MSNPILPSTLKVTATDVEYWLSNSKDAIEFLAGEEQSSVPPAWEQPALEYVVLMTTEGNTLVVPGAELMQFQEHPLATTNPGVDPSTKGQPGELRTMLAQESPDSEWSVVWGTRLARLWSNCRAPLALLWGFGSLWCLGLAVIRIRRFHKVLAHTSPAPEKLIASARRLAKRIGLRRTPQVRLAPGVSNPLVWRGLRQSYIVLPAELLRQLSRQQAATLLTHELAHLRRKDHVMRWLELAATILYWWNPILWFARRQLRESEERCCDAWVVWAMPQAARDYLDTVLKTVDFLSTRKARLPLAATGMGHFQELQTRFEQVITNHQDRREHNRLSRFARCGLAIVALAMLPLVPTLTAQGIVQANVILQESHGASEVATGRNLHGQDITVELQSSAPSAAWSTALYSRASQLSPSVKNLPGVLATDADIEAVATSTDGRLLAVGRTSGDIEFYKNSAAGLVMIWSASTQDGHTHDDKVTSMAFSSDGHRLASAGRDGQVQVREAASGEIQESWQASESWLTDAAFSPRGDLLAVGGYDRTLQVFDLTQADGTTDAPRSVANGKHDSAVRALQFLPQNSQLATVDSAGNLSLWDLNERKQLALLHRVAAHHGVARDVAVNAIGNRLATVGEDGQLRLWAWKANELAEERSAESDDLLSHVAFEFDDRLLVSAGWSGNIHLHDGTTGEIINKVAADPGRPVRNLAINRDNILLAGGQSPGISLWGFDQPVATYYVPAKVQLQPIRFGVSTQYVAASSGETPTAPRPFVPGMDLSQTKSLAPKNVVVYFAQDEFSNSQSEARQSQLANDRASQTTSTKSSNEQFAPACDEPNPKP